MGWNLPDVQYDRRGVVPCAEVLAELAATDARGSYGPDSEWAVKAVARQNGGYPEIVKYKAELKIGASEFEGEVSRVCQNTETPTRRTFKLSCVFLPSPSCAAVQLLRELMPETFVAELQCCLLWHLK